MMRRGDALSLQIVPLTIRGRAINDEAIDACGDALNALYGNGFQISRSHEDIAYPHAIAIVAIQTEMDEGCTAIAERFSVAAHHHEAIDPISQIIDQQLVAVAAYGIQHRLMQ